MERLKSIVLSGCGEEFLSFITWQKKRKSLSSEHQKYTKEASSKYDAT